MLDHLRTQMLRASGEIDSCGLYINVSHHFRQAEYIAPTLDHECSKGMPQPVEGELKPAWSAHLYNQPL